MENHSAKSLMLLKALATLNQVISYNHPINVVKSHMSIEDMTYKNRKVVVENMIIIYS